MRLKLTIFLFFISLTILGDNIYCKSCRKTIRGRYFISAQKETFCSKKCLGKTLTKCQRCKQPCFKGTISFNRKIYCSQKCMQLDNCCQICNGLMERFTIIKNANNEDILICPKCVKAPRCFNCRMPNQWIKRISSNRYICPKCNKTAVTNINEVKTLVRQVRNDLAKLYGFDNKHHINIRFVDYNELDRATPHLPSNPNNLKLAAMLYKYEVITMQKGNQTSKKLGKEFCSIIFLTHIPKEQLIDTIAHELTHDYLRHKIGIITPQNIKYEEGFCENIAANYNIKRGKKNLNIKKEHNPDPIYGVGYRVMKNYLTNHGFNQTLMFLRSKATNPLYAK